jgi:hypothetical protein
LKKFLIDKDITNVYIEKSDTLNNLLIFIQKALIIQQNNTNKVKFNKFDKTVYNYLESNNFFQMRYNETEQNNIIVTKQMMKLVLSSEKTEEIEEIKKTVEIEESSDDLDEIEKMEKELEAGITPKRSKAIVKVC